MDDPSAHVYVDELWTEVGLHSLEQLLAQHHGAATHAHHVAVEQADVLGFVAFGDQRKEVEVGADATTAQALGPFAGHFHLSQVRVGGNALSDANGVEHSGEYCPEGAEATTGCS